VSVLLFGPRGYIGGHLLRQFPASRTSNADIADPVAVAAALDASLPGIVINAVGRTGTPNVDWCEDHKEETFRSNVLGPIVLAEECRKRGIYLVHIGSGCIYTGDNAGAGYSEHDPANFQGSYYSRTKQWVEQMLREFSEPIGGRGGIVMLRIRMPFEIGDHPKNLLSKLPRFTRVIDVTNSITYIPDFLSVMEQLISRRATGVWNVVNPGPISLFRIMQMYREIVDPMHCFMSMTEEEAAPLTKAPRSNCVLSTEKLSLAGISLPNAEQRVSECLQELKRRKAAKA
jgi:dTDP-4-dehydrorhamnose reductase